MVVTFHARPVAFSRAALICAPLVAIVADSCDGVNASETGRSNEPTRGPLGAAEAPVDGAADEFVPAVPPHAAMTRPAASAHPNGPRTLKRMGTLLRSLGTTV